ncbi:MAG TPA: hypothetical protein VE251_00965 [Xanthobacteraceae bacterium]|jgi:hypothetical protein|nr:hypothetical protein [Xanthobacteraceae bacterium]
MDRILAELDGMSQQDLIARVASNEELTKFERAMWISNYKLLYGIRHSNDEHRKLEDEWQRTVMLSLTGNKALEIAGLNDLIPLIPALKGVAQTALDLKRVKQALVFIGGFSLAFWIWVAGGVEYLRKLVIVMFGGTA